MPSVFTPEMPSTTSSGSSSATATDTCAHASARVRPTTENIFTELLEKMPHEDTIRIAARAASDPSCTRSTRPT